MRKGICLFKKDWARIGWSVLFGIHHIVLEQQIETR